MTRKLEMFRLFIIVIVFGIQSHAFGIQDFEHKSEFSSATSRGNSPYESYNTKTTNRVILDKMHDITFGGHYTYGSINEDQLEIARNWDANFKYLTAFTKKNYAFLGFVVEGDEFAGYSERNNIDLGVSTKYIDTDVFKIYFEYGYRQTVEVPIDSSGTNKDQKLRFYAVLDDEITKNSSFNFWLEYVPNLSRTDDYLINFEPSFRVAVNSIFSLKIAYKGMYDNLPAIESRKYYDETYTTSLLAKF